MDEEKHTKSVLIRIKPSSWGDKCLREAGGDRFRRSCVAGLGWRFFNWFGGWIYRGKDFKE